MLLFLSNRRGRWKNKDDLPRWRFSIVTWQEEGFDWSDCSKAKIQSGTEPGPKEKSSNFAQWEHVTCVKDQVVGFRLRFKQAQTGATPGSLRFSSTLRVWTHTRSRSHTHAAGPNQSVSRLKTSRGTTIKISQATSLSLVFHVNTSTWNTRSLLVWESAQNGQSWSSGALCWVCIVFICPSGPVSSVSVIFHRSCWKWKITTQTYTVQRDNYICVSMYCTCAYSFLWYVTAFPCVTVVALCVCVCARGGALCKNRLLGIIKSAETDCTEPYTGGEWAMLCGRRGGEKKISRVRTRKKGRGLNADLAKIQKTNITTF